jgi:hypothetical protein
LNYDNYNSLFSTQKRNAPLYGNPYKGEVNDSRLILETNIRAHVGTSLQQRIVIDLTQEIRLDQFDEWGTEPVGEYINDPW